jgi:hypothetical protein
MGGGMDFGGGDEMAAAADSAEATLDENPGGDMEAL